MNGRCQDSLSADASPTHTRHAKIARRANLSRLVAVAVSPKSQASSTLSRLDEEGRYGRSSRNVGAGCDGRGWRRRAHVARTNDADADGEVVWSWRPDAGAKSAMMLRITLVTGARKPGPRGERERSRNTIAQGRPDVLAEPVVTAACYFCCRRAMGAACTRPSLRPLYFEGALLRHKLGRQAPRDREVLPFRRAVPSCRSLAV
jgi:hypothetical protein